MRLIQMAPLGALLLLMVGVLRADDNVATVAQPYLIDIPTAETVRHYGYNVSFRFAREGNIQAKTVFGVLPRLNIGFGFDGERVIGTESSRLNRPTINAAFRFFDGRGALPALALGYDGQGYRYNRDRKKYDEREKGLYMVATGETGVPDLFLHGGVNVYDFDDEDSAARFFAGVSWTYQHLFGLMAEYDNLNYYRDRRINAGGRFYLSPVFTLDVVARNVPEVRGSQGREFERVVLLSYTGAF